MKFKNIFLFSFFTIFLFSFGLSQEVSKPFDMKISYCDYLGKLDGIDYYLEYNYIKKKYAIEKRNNTELVSRHELNYEGSRPAMPKIINGKIYLIYHVSGSSKYTVDLVELNKDLLEVSRVKLFENNNNGEGFELNSFWCDVNEKGVVLFEYDTKNNLAYRVSYFFENSEFKRNEIKFNETILRNYFEGIIDEELNLTLLACSAKGGRTPDEYFIFHFTNDLSEFTSVTTLLDKKSKTEINNLKLYTDTQGRVKIIGTKYTDTFPFMSYVFYEFSKDFKTVNEVKAINIKESSVVKNVDITAESKSSILDMVQSDNEIILICSYGTDYYESPGFGSILITKIDLEKNEIVWSNRINRYTINYYSDHKGLWKSCNMPTNERFDVSIFYQNDDIYLFYNDEPLYKKPDFKGDKSKEKARLNSSTTIAISNSIPYFSKVNKNTGEITVNQLMDVFPDLPGNSTHSFAQAGLNRKEENGIVLVIGPFGMYFRSNNSYELHIPYEKL